MSVTTGIFSGMSGKSDTKVVVPTMKLGSEQLTNKDPLLGRVAYEKAPNILNSAIDYSTRRGVLPCIGITEHVLRQAPQNAANAYQAPRGVASFSGTGLAAVGYRNDYPELRPFSSIHMGQFSPLGA